MKHSDLEKSWQKVLAPEFEKEYMQKLQAFLDDEVKSGVTIYPQEDDLFAALNLSPLEDTKVVIVGQDPYHGPDQAHGLCFSVKPGIRIPPSLLNIYKEMEQDLDIPRANHGHLISWAQQGVLMINNVLTVAKGSAGSHRKKGWEQFTDRIIDILNERKKNLVFLLWGKDAQKKCAKINREKHLVLESAHPSPLAGKRFFGNNHFSKTNTYLADLGKEIIIWQLPSV